MTRMRLPSPGTVGAPADDEHAIAAAEHCRTCPHEHTEAYLELAQRGEALLNSNQQRVPNDQASKATSRGAA